MKTVRHDFTLRVRDKGWTMVELAARWDILPRQMSNIAANPKQVHWDALIGLPTKTDKEL